MEELVSTQTFWQGRRVLITGHTGFKGGWLALWLQMLGSRVAGYALPPATQPSLFEIAGVGQRMVSTLADIRNPEALLAAFARHQPEVVFHLAAQAMVLPSYAHPADTYSTNVMGTVNLLDAVRQTPGVRAVVVVTTDKCYATRESGPAYRESDPLGGNDPYSSSKACAELVTAAYRCSFFNPADPDGHRAVIATARAGNAIGGGDWSAQRLIPDAMRALVEKRPLQVRHPEAIRPWQHVLDALAGYLLLAERLYLQGADFAQPWNFGPSEECSHSVAQVLETLVKLWGEEAAWQDDPTSHRRETNSLRLDAAQAVSRLPWRPRCSLDSSLTMTVDWYRAQRDGKDMAEFSRRQIDAYCHMAGLPVAK